MTRSSSRPHLPAQGGDAEAPPTRTSLTQYNKYKIGQLTPGPTHACFSGLVVNLQNHLPDANAPSRATGCIKIALQDETGEILVTLWFADTRYKLTLNTVMTLWTTHVCSSTPPATAPHANANTVPASISTSLYPERNFGCGLRIFRRGLPGVPLAEKDLWSRVSRDVHAGGIMSLERLKHGSMAGVESVKLLVRVAEVGKAVLGSTSGPSCQKFPAVSVGVVDAPRPRSPTSLIFDNPLHESVSQLRPDSTILLVTHARILSRRLIVLSHESRVFVDPDIPAARHLRKGFAPQPFQPCNMSLEESRLALLFNSKHTPRPPPLTLSALEDMVSKDPGKPRIGSCSVILTSLHLVELFEGDALFCMSCPRCLEPVYANQPEIQCGCGNEDIVGLRPNPRILGGFSDETSGMLCPRTAVLSPPDNKDQERRDTLLLITDKAYTSLVGCTPSAFAEQLTSHTNHAQQVDHMRQIEETLSWQRVTLVLGWTGDCDGDGAAEGENGDEDEYDLDKVSGSEKGLGTPPGRQELARRLVLLDVLDML